MVLTAGLLAPARGLSAQTTARAPQAPAPSTSSATTTTASPASATPSKTHKRHKKENPVPIAEVAPTPPPPPPTLEQTPPTAPHITYQGGQLSIDARNSTLSQVLHAVQLQTGASIEMPASASSDRVVAQLGPGQPKDVLNTLLNGSKFDYIILGVTGNPGAVQKVILTPRQSLGASNVNVAQNNNQVQNQEVDDEAQPDEGVPANEVEAENPVPEQPPPPPPGGFHRPMMMPPGQQDPNQANGDPANGVKSPEQLMQELQQMQQQQQQYQQQLNPANQNQPQ